MDDGSVQWFRTEGMVCCLIAQAYVEIWILSYGSVAGYCYTDTSRGCSNQWVCLT